MSESRNQLCARVTQDGKCSLVLGEGEAGVGGKEEKKQEKLAPKAQSSAREL